jgi:hypothetical protein
MGADGRVEKHVEPIDPNRFEPPSAAEEPLELDRPVTIKPPEEVLPEPPPPPPRRSNAIKVIIGALVVGMLVLAGALIFKPNIPLPDSVRDSNLVREMSIARGQVIIMSEPMGAKVFISDSMVGTTPYAADNRWVGDVPVRLEAKGLAPFVTSFQGGKDQTLEVDIKKRESHTR